MNNLLIENKTLKECYVETFIPALERMVEKEKEHLAFLEIHDRKDYPMVVRFISHSKSWLEMLKEMLNEYKDHAERL